MNTKKCRRVLLWVAASLLGLWLGIRYLLPILLPFLIGYLLSRLAEPLLTRLQRKTGAPRWLCAVLCVSAVYLLLGLSLFFLLRVLFHELRDFAAQLPALLSSLAAPLERLRAALEQVADRLPDGLGSAARAWIDNLFASGSILAETAANRLIALLSRLLSGLPALILFLVTTVLSTFMISIELPQLRQAAIKRAPKVWQRRGRHVALRLRRALGGWFIAQGKLLAVVFAIVSCGLALLRVEFALLFGLGIALIDALPVFGSGTVLLPWALLRFLQADRRLGVGLVCVYLAAMLTRTALEPRLIGRQIGLNPLLTLLALYAGFRLFGVVGMLLLPIAAILIKQLYDLTEPQRG